MNKENEFWNFKVWEAFEQKLYAECLSAEHVEGNGVEEFYETVWKLENGESQERSLEPPRFKHLVRLSKDSIKYVLPSDDMDKLPIKVTESAKYQLKKSDKRVWNLITGFKDMSIPAKKTMDFRAFIDAWNPIEHSDPQYWNLMKLIAIGSKWKGVKLALCSEPEGGKTSNYTVMGLITKDVSKITNPTLAKFEFLMHHNKVIVPDEMPNWAADTARAVESTFLAIGDGSPDYNAHSLKQNKSANKMDADSLSIIFCYNRPQDMKSGQKFFDEVWHNPAAIKSRYPQLLVKGIVKSKVAKLSKEEARLIMEQHFDKMAEFAKNFSYFSKYLNNEFHNYNRNVTKSFSGRHSSNLQGVIDAIDAYAKDEMEFFSICALLNTAIADHKEMVRKWKSEEVTVPSTPFDKFESE